MVIGKKKLHRTVLILAVAGAFFTSCDDTKKEEDKEDLVETHDTIKSTVVNVNGELFSVPSPVQTALLIQRSGVSYDKATLNMHNKVHTYSTDYARAFNLGVYGADLGYVSLYNQTQDALGYLTAIKHLSDKLGLSAAFDASTMERISKNITNKDSMMVLVGLAYRASDAYLKSNRRNDISTAILAGGWIESMNFSVAAYKSKPGESLRNRIAQQKQALSSLIKILGSNSSPEVAEIAAMLTDLAKVYEGIQFKYNYVDPQTDSTKKVTYINCTTEVIISDEQLSQISSKVQEIRNKIVNTTKS